LAALVAVEEGDPILLVMPADHVITEQVAFQHAIAIGAKAAAKGALVTFGIVPDRPETGYGYLRSGEALAEGEGVRALLEFVDALVSPGERLDGPERLARFLATSEARARFEQEAKVLRQMLASGQLPPPLMGDQAAQRCKGCSLQERCQPQATTTLLAAARRSLFDPEA